MNISLLDKLPISQKVKIAIPYSNAMEAANAVVINYIDTGHGRTLLNLDNGSLLDSKQSLEDLVTFVQVASEEGVKVFNEYFQNHDISKELLKEKINEFVEDSDLKGTFNLIQMKYYGGDLLFHYGRSLEENQTTDQKEEIINHATDDLSVKFGIPEKRRDSLREYFHIWMYHPHLVSKI